jgi:crotonobetainyl-CoA:carnitine CoA-transferase CaiB-like acyl-CoA transferase
MDEAEQALSEADVPFAPILDIARIAEHPLFRARAMVDVTLHDGTVAPMVGVFPHLSKTPGRVTAPGPRPGEHTRDILAEVGVPPAELEALERKGVIGTFAGAGAQP